MNGRIWLGFSGPRSPKVDAMAARPFLREVTLRLPRVLWPLPKRYGHVLAFTEDGKIVEDLQDPSGVYPETTGATETVDRVYVQNLHLNSIGWLAVVVVGVVAVVGPQRHRNGYPPPPHWEQTLRSKTRLTRGPTRKEYR